MNENFEKALKVILTADINTSPRFLKHDLAGQDFDQPGTDNINSVLILDVDDIKLITDVDVGDINSMSIGEKEQFYHYFWNELNCDKIECDMLRLHIFDMGVDCGTIRAAKIVQKLLAIEDDGIIGPESLRNINSQKDFVYWNKWGLDEFPMYLWQRYVMERFTHYNYLAYKVNTDLLIFLNDWINRVKKTNYL